MGAADQPRDANGRWVSVGAGVTLPNGKSGVVSSIVGKKATVTGANGQHFVVDLKDTVATGKVFKDSFAGKSHKDKVATIAAKVDLPPKIIDKIAKINDGSSEGTLYVPKAATDAHIAQIKKAFPGKLIQKIDANKYTRTYKDVKASPKAQFVAKGDMVKVAGSAAPLEVIKDKGDQVVVKNTVTGHTQTVDKTDTKVVVKDEPWKTAPGDASKEVFKGQGTSVGQALANNVTTGDTVYNEVGTPFKVSAVSKDSVTLTGPLGSNTTYPDKVFASTNFSHTKPTAVTLPPVGSKVVGKSGAQYEVIGHNDEGGIGIKTKSGDALAVPKGSVSNYTPVESKPQASSYGTPPERIAKFMKAGVSSTIAKKMAIVNDGTHEDKLYVPLIATASDVVALQKAFPGKTIQKINVHTYAKGKSQSKAPGLKFKHNKSLDDKFAKNKAKLGTVAKDVVSNVQSVEPDFGDKAYEAPHFKRQPLKDGDTLDETRDGVVNGQKVPPPNAQMKAWSKHKNVPTVEDFTGIGYIGIRADEAKGNETAKVKKMNDALDAAPTYEGVTYRGLNLSPGHPKYAETMANFTTVGNEVEMKSSSSTSRAVRTAGKFASSGSGTRVVLRIAAKTGVPVEHVSNFEHEKEVILRRDSRYKVVGVAKNVQVQTPYGKQSCLVIDLEEIH